MIQTRKFFTPPTQNGAVFSPCRRYRYLLHRVWRPNEALLGFIMLNPSNADEDENDNTIRRCIGFGKTWGYGGIVVANLFAWIATDPSQLTTVGDPVGRDNDDHIQNIGAARIVAAWGASFGSDKKVRRIERTLEILHGHYRRIYCLGQKTAGGMPRHPLYLPRDAELNIFSEIK